MKNLFLLVTAIFVSQLSYSNSYAKEDFVLYSQAKFEIKNFKRCASTLSNCTDINELVGKTASLYINPKSEYSFPGVIMSGYFDAIRPFIGQQGLHGANGQSLNPLSQSFECKNSDTHYSCVIQFKGEINHNYNGYYKSLTNYKNKLTFSVDRGSMEKVYNFYALKTGAKISIIFESTTYHNDKFDDNNWKTTKTLLSTELEMQK